MTSLRHLSFLTALALLLPGCGGMPAEPPRIERISAEQLEASLPQPTAALPLEQVVALVRQGVGATEIIGRITASGSRYRLSATQLVELERQGVPLAILDHMVADERRHIFDDMAADAARRDQACRLRIEQEVLLCRSQAMPPVWFPGQPPFMNCFPSPPGSPFWRCL